MNRPISGKIILFLGDNSWPWNPRKSIKCSKAQILA